MGVFCDICTPHTRQVQLVQPYLCRHAVILQCLFCHRACLCNNSKWCLPSFVSPSSYTVLLLWCFLLNINRWAYFPEKSKTSFKKGGGLFSRLSYWGFVTNLEVVVAMAMLLFAIYIPQNSKAMHMH